MQLFLEHFGVSVAAITGVLAARGKQVDLFGVVVLALVTAFGGGTVRDLLLDTPRIFWIEAPAFLYNAFATALVTFVIVRFRELPMTVLLVADAFALALFTMVGTRKGLGFEVVPAIAVMMGVITGVVGGMLRDVLLGQIPLVFRREIYLYATAAFCGASAFVTLEHFRWNPQVNMIIGVSVTLLLRLIGIKWRIGLPLLRHKTPSSPAGQ
jgi:uncharacterized membrane protein YeiH